MIGVENVRNVRILEDYLYIIFLLSYSLHLRRYIEYASIMQPTIKLTFLTNLTLDFDSQPYWVKPSQDNHCLVVLEEVLFRKIRIQDFHLSLEVF